MGRPRVARFVGRFMTSASTFLYVGIFFLDDTDVPRLTRVSAPLGVPARVYEGVTKIA
jgi:hypothetical protein